MLLKRNNPELKYCLTYDCLTAYCRLPQNLDLDKGCSEDSGKVITGGSHNFHFGPRYLHNFDSDYFSTALTLKYREEVEKDGVGNSIYLIADFKAVEFLAPTVPKGS